MFVRLFQSFERVRFINQHAFRENTDFLTAYRLLKRCYPWPDYAICALLSSHGCQLSRWKAGLTRPRASIAGFIAVLVMFRIGAAKTGHDLLRAGRLLSTGELERMVDRFLAGEAQAIARQKERAEARKRAKRVPQQDIPPTSEAK